MLKKPYKFLNNIGNNNYYSLKIEDVYYLVTESFLKSKRKKEFTQGIKILPITSFWLNLFLEVLNLKHIGEDEKDWGIEKEPIYEILDVKKLRERLRNNHKEFAKAMEEKKFISAFDYAKFPHSEAIKQFSIETETSPICVEFKGAYLRVHHLAKTTSLGNVVIHSCLAQGKPSNETVVAIETYVFDRATIEKFILNVGNTEKVGGEK